MYTRKQKNVRTLRRKQRGGFYGEEDKTRVAHHIASTNADQQKQIVHCMSQLKRFAPCKENPIRLYQFFYNLGRLQELLGETTKPGIWWSPIEALINAGNYVALPSHIDKLQELIGLPYDDALIAKGC